MEYYSYLRPKADLGVWLINTHVDRERKRIFCGIAIFTSGLSLPMGVYNEQGKWIAKVIIPEEVQKAKMLQSYSNKQDLLEVEIE